MKFQARLFPRFLQRLGAVLAVFLCGAFASAAWADPPGRVGRLGDTTGQVWLYTPDSGEWVSATRNRPLTSGDRLATDASARAEMRIGSTTVRLDSGTELEVLRIDDDVVSLQLHNGSIATRLRNQEAANEFELRTVEGRFLTHRPGRYRFDRADDTSNVTVSTGEALYEGPGSALTVYPGQRAEFWLEGGKSAQYSITDPVRDGFASWSGERDRRDDRSASTRYVSPEMTGVEDLDRYGRWEQAPDYGPVWYPRYVPAGWAPYGAGHWAWVSPWGWTWVDDMPWGFAPFHYGRWMMFNDAWCWVPGTYVRRPVYAPALVGWIGGPHLSLSISVGGSPAPAVGWFPLAPREVYVPTYRVSPTYVQQVNVTHVTNITNITTIVNNPQQAVTNVEYRNRRFPHAVTVVPQTVMVNRQPVAPVAAQTRNLAAVQQLVNQPVQKLVVSAPPVATPAITPAIAEARRMHTHGNDAARPAMAQSLAPSPIVVPPSPPRVSGIIGRGLVDGDLRAKQAQDPQRRRDMKEEPRPAPATTASPAPTARAQATPPQAAPAPRVEPAAPATAPLARPQAVTPVPPPPNRLNTSNGGGATPPAAPVETARPAAPRPAPTATPPAAPAPAPQAAVVSPAQRPQAAPSPAPPRGVPPPPMQQPVEARAHPHEVPPQARPHPEGAPQAVQPRPPQAEQKPQQRQQEQQQPNRKPEARAPVPPQQGGGEARPPNRDERHARTDRRGEPREHQPN